MPYLLLLKSSKILNCRLLQIVGGALCVKLLSTSSRMDPEHKHMDGSRGGQRVRTPLKNHKLLYVSLEILVEKGGSYSTL